MQLFLEKIKESIDNGTFVKLTLSKTRQKEALKNVYGRLVFIKNQLNLSLTYRYETKDVVQNVAVSACLEALQTLLEQHFFNAHLFTTESDFILEISKKGKINFKKQSATFRDTPELTHDKAKKRFVTPDRPYLHALGITSEDGKVLKNWQSKYKQIDKYIEIIDVLLQNTPLPDVIHIVDMGCGKGYLTFALYDYLVNQKQKSVKITGIELREPLVLFCNEVAKAVGFEDLNFIAQDIKDYPAEKIDVLIALHACDIATDIALGKGVLSDAALIVAAPCCHKQIRQQMKRHSSLQPILKHGILEERQAEMVTDGIRALLLEGHGYSSKVFEFVSNEHTNKNLMVVGTKNNKPDTQALEEVQVIKQQFGIEYHYLEKVLEQKDFS
jgi:SAM-dependent methyltransferase